MMNQLFGDALGGARGPFNVQLRCYSVAMCPGIGSQDRMEEINNGGKILLPPSCLDWLTRLNVTYPMMFKLVNPNPDFQRVTHAGVLEFLAEEGKCHLPYWMMKQLMLDEGQVVSVASATLPVATYAKFKAQSVEFLDLTNPKVVLEIQLRKFACLTKNDIIAFQYVGRLYELLVVEVRPSNAVCIIECDMNTEFEAPEGYVEPERTPRASRISESIPGGSALAELDAPPPLPTSGSASSFAAFAGAGQRLDGKKMNEAQESHQATAIAIAKGLYLGAPILDYRPGTLNFHRNYVRQDVKRADDAEAAANFAAFEGSGNSLKPKKK